MPTAFDFGPFGSGLAPRPRLARASPATPGTGIVIRPAIGGGMCQRVVDAGRVAEPRGPPIVPFMSDRSIAVRLKGDVP
jgi:hypothetical protein